MLDWAALRRERRAALIAFFTAGYPDRAGSLAALRGAAAAGADIIELGIPFSDPLADGPTIQRASQAALAGGMTAAGALSLVREAGLKAPVVLMTYANPVLAYGADRFVRDATAAGASGILLTDVPAGADPALERAVSGSTLALVRLVAPTTPDTRLALALEGAGGFVYLISRLGVTGVRTDAPPELETQVARVRRATSLPVAVGFGITTPDHVRAAARVADGVVVGSALVAEIERGGAEGSSRLVAALAAATRNAK